MQQPEKQKTLLAYVKKHFRKEGYEVKEAVKDTIKIFTSDKSITFKCKNNGEIVEIASRMRRGRQNTAAPNPVETDKKTAKKISGDKKPVPRREWIHEITDIPAKKKKTANTEVSNAADIEARPKRHRCTKTEMKTAGAAETIEKEKKDSRPSVKGDSSTKKTEDAPLKEKILIAQNDSGDSSTKTKTDKKTIKVKTEAVAKEDKLRQSAKTIADKEASTTSDPDEVIHVSETANPYKPGDSVELIYGSHLAYTVEECIGNTCRVVVSTGEWSEYTIAASDLRSSKKPARKIESGKVGKNIWDLWKEYPCSDDARAKETAVWKEISTRNILLTRKYRRVMKMKLKKELSSDTEQQEQGE